MSITAFLTLCVLGIDFMLYVLFQWVYGDKRRALARKLTVLKNDMKTQPPGPRLVSSRKSANGKPSASKAA